LKIHPNDLVLEGLVQAREGDPRRLLDHLDCCPGCFQRFETLRSGAENGAGDSYGSALESSHEVYRRRRSALHQERAEAAGLVDELAVLRPDQREAALRTSPRFSTWGVFERLVEKSLAVAAQSPRESEDLGLLALRISDGLRIEEHRRELIEDLRARAWAHIGNARRERGDLAGAEAAFRRAYSHLLEGTRDPLERALLSSLRAALLRDQGHGEAALRLLQRALVIFQDLGQQHRVARCLDDMAAFWRSAKKKGGAGEASGSPPFVQA
jgi:tetratricopeptide (TPR) repeat protein